MIEFKFSQKIQVKIKIASSEKLLPMKPTIVMDLPSESSTWGGLCLIHFKLCLSNRTHTPPPPPNHNILFLSVCMRCQPQIKTMFAHFLKQKFD